MEEVVQCNLLLCTYLGIYTTNIIFQSINNDVNEGPKTFAVSK
jgi:hypothetical protein